MANLYDDFRKMKDDFFAHDPHSPLTHEQRHHFAGLKYFEPNDALRLELPLEEFAEKDVIQMQTSTGNVQTYERWGRIRFEVDGEPAELTIFANEHGLFMPFTDATSGKETYGAGRYLEPETIGGGKVSVDFNMAYSPYCAYNDLYSCPIPPFENRLKVPIRAGEKSFKES
ncbi:MAG: DUF1684 domain-containing protein [Anaerolineales bacterium]